MNTDISKRVRVRFAPSPTGYMHIGSLRMALTDFLIARKYVGSFVIRIEDTDQKRFVEGAVENLVRMLDTLGLHPDEGVLCEDGRVTERGSFGPYTQSHRLDTYRKYVDELLEQNKAYRCFCSAERLEQVRATQVANKQAPKYDRHCLALAESDVQARLTRGESHVVRMMIPADREVVLEDLVRGTVTFHTRDIDDQVIFKSDGYPTYHLAVVVDDFLMNISHVIRGEEWLPSTPKHLLLYEAFGWPIPQFAHLPLLLNMDRSKLSKRQGDVAVEEYLAKGYLAEALINFVALLGWNPGKGETQEIFSLDELVARFDLHQVNKAGAIFDVKKLDWMNAEYIKALTIDELYQRAKPFFQAKDGFKHWNAEHEAWSEVQREQYMRRVLEVERERLTTLSDVGEMNPFFFTEPQGDGAKLPWKNNTPEQTRTSLQQALALLQSLDDASWTREGLGATLLEAAGEKRGDFLWPLRMALSGAEKSPPPQDIAWVIGKSATLVRIQKAIDLL